MRWTLLVIQSWSRAWYYYVLSGLLPFYGHWHAAILGALPINWLNPAFGWKRGSARTGFGLTANGHTMVRGGSQAVCATAAATDPAPTAPDPAGSSKTVRANSAAMECHRRARRSIG